MFDTTMIGKRIKQARIEKNMTQMALADAMGVSYQAVSNWERGNSMPDISKLGDLCEVLDETLDALLGLEESTPNVIKKALNNEALTMEELTEVAPVLLPEDVKARMQNQNVKNGETAAADSHTEQRESKKKLDLSRIGELAPYLDQEYLDEVVRSADLKDLEGIEEVAPFLSRETLDYIVEQAGLDDLETISEIAPFLSRDTVDKLVNRCTEAKNFSTLEMLAPFISRATLDRLAENVQADSIWEVVSIAPFFSSEALDKLVRRCEHEEKIEAIEELAPFLSEETLTGMVDRCIENNKVQNLEEIYPFLPKEAMRKLAKYMMAQKKMNVQDDPLSCV